MICKNLKCNKEHDGSFATGKFCSRSCANSRIIKDANSFKKIINCFECKQPLEVDKRSDVKVTCQKCKELRKICLVCGSKKIIGCKIPHICKHYQMFRTLIKHFTFDKNVLGTENVYQEYFRIQKLLSDDYHINELSTLELQKKYNCDNQRVMNSFKFLDIKCRNLSEAGALAVMNNKLCHPNQFHTSWYISWEGKEFFLRSSFELDYCQKLDNEKIKYEVENLKISYWDSQALKQRTAVPDFYLPESNTIVEIKSTWTLDIQNMKDRVKVYKINGYNFKLILNKVETDLESLV